MTKYPGIDDAEIGNPTTQQKRFVNEYLDKVFISAIKLGQLSADQRLEYADELLRFERENFEDSNGNITGDNDSKLTNPLVEKRLQASPIIIPTIHSLDQESINFNFSWSELAENNENEINDAIKSYVANEERYQFKKLTPKEESSLKNVFKHWESATPRQMRIYYYRYLLCKNTLINRYIVESRENIWQSEVGIKTIMRLLSEYIADCKVDSLAKEKDQIQNRINSGGEDFTLGNNTFPIKDCFYLFEVFELVLAY